MLAAVDGDLAYRVRGDGARLLLMHAGVFGDWFQPLWQDPGFTGLELVDYRRIGYAPSARPAKVLSMADHAGHAAALLDHLGGRPATVVGHSSAGLMALDLAVRRPDLVSGLLVHSPGLRARVSAALQSSHCASGPDRTLATTRCVAHEDCGVV